MWDRKLLKIIGGIDVLGRLMASRSESAPGVYEVAARYLARPRLLARRLVQIAVLIVLAVDVAYAADYHLDCAEGRDVTSGLTPSEAWRTLDKVSAHVFYGGDRLLLKRNTRCEGTLAPQGSGEAGVPIVLGTYGDGSIPKIDAKGADAGLRLWNQSHWRVQDIEVGGSRVYGVYVGGDIGVMRGIELRDVIARDVHGPLTSKMSGLIVVEARGEAIFENVTIDGARAAGTTQWAGIVVNGARWEPSLANHRSRNVTIRNSIANDIWGDGIVLFQVERGLIERSATWATGMQPQHTLGTPNGLWTWRCVDCVVRECESFWAHSPDVDGGAFDIDWGNKRNTIERSYGHDVQAYCIGVFGAERSVTTGSVIRGNVCAGLGRAPVVRDHGAIDLWTWSGGSLDGVVIEDNLIHWEPPVKTPAIKNNARWKGSQGLVIRRNTIEAEIEPGRERGGSLEFTLDESDDARGLRVLAESAKVQFAAKGLRVTESAGQPQVVYRDASGSVVRSWTGYAPAAEVLWLVRQRMGPPIWR